MNPKETVKQIQDLTIALVGSGLSNEQNFPSTHGDAAAEFEISVNNATSMTIALKNVAYSDIYAELNQARCYNFKMLDGALVALRYRFRAGVICEHSLSYFPSPNLEHFQNEPEIYMEDEIYADIVARNIVPFPVRFDFSDDTAKFVEIHHPYSHMTLGQYENCRIPVCSPLTPLTFGSFILRNFYNTGFRLYSDDIPSSTVCFEKTITAEEQGVPHMVCSTL